jgi:hypothetical protein
MEKHTECLRIDVFQRSVSEVTEACTYKSFSQKLVILNALVRTGMTAVYAVRIETN